jgi:flagellar protein FliS
MVSNQGFNAYLETGIKTASQGKLIVLLYDEAIRQITTAIGKIDSGGKVKPREIEVFNRNILKAQDIITELMVSLDMEKGGEVATNLLALYVYFNHELLDAHISMNKEKLSFIFGMLSQLRDAWAAAAVNAVSIQPVAIRSGVDING